MDKKFYTNIPITMEVHAELSAIRADMAQMAGAAPMRFSLNSAVMLLLKMYRAQLPPIEWVKEQLETLPGRGRPKKELVPGGVKVSVRRYSHDFRRDAKSPDIGVICIECGYAMKRNDPMTQDRCPVKTGRMVAVTHLREGEDFLPIDA